jgi:hypothetical protein
MTYADGEIIKGVWDNGEYTGNDKESWQESWF